MSTEEGKSRSNNRDDSMPRTRDDLSSTDLKAPTKAQQQRLSNKINNSTTKTPTSSTSNAETHTSDNVDSNQSTPTSTPSNSQQNSPTKTTQSKSSKNKKKNDAKKRNSNLRKQQQKNKSANGDGNLNAAKSPSANDQDQSNIPLHDDKPLPSFNSDNNHSSNSLSNTNSPNKKSNKDNINRINNSTTKQQMEQRADLNSPVSNNATDDDVSKSTLQESEATQSSSKEDPNDATKSINKNANNSHQTSDNSQPNKISVDSNVWIRKQRENRELKEQLRLRDTQLQNFADRIKQQIVKIKELEASLVSTTKTCDQFEKLVQQELKNRTRFENDIDNLNQTVMKLKSQIDLLEKEKAANNELIRTLNATLMERETEVSILKLKMTRMQTTTSSTVNNSRLPSHSSTNDAPGSTSITRQSDAAKAFAISGRSNSEFSRNSYARSTMLADAAVTTRSSTSQLQQMSSADRDASIWSRVPEELTPSKRPLLLERNFQQSAFYSDPNHSVNANSSPSSQQHSTPLSKDNRHYKTLPRSMKSPEVPILQANNILTNQSRSASMDKQPDNSGRQAQLFQHCLVTNLDESNSTSSGGTRTADLTIAAQSSINHSLRSNAENSNLTNEQTSHYQTISNNHLEAKETPGKDESKVTTKVESHQPPSLPMRSPSSPIKISTGFKKILNVFRRSDSSAESYQQINNAIRGSQTEVPVTPNSGPFQRGATRSTLGGMPGNSRGLGSNRRDLQTDKPFAEWNTDMLVDWLTSIGLSMYANQCRRWVKCGAHIMNATPTEVDKGLGITNHLHRKKLRLAISELNGDCDKITKAAAKLDYLWIARWLDDIGLPQYKEAFINARVDGRVLNYLTVEDLFSMGVKSVLHHCSIRCGIKVLRSINFDLQLLKRRATSEEIDLMKLRRQKIDKGEQNDSDVNPTDGAIQTGGNDEFVDVQLWTCHRVMEWLRMIDFAEFAPNLRGSGVHGGLIMYEDRFNIDTFSSLLGIPSSRTLLRRHLATFFDDLICLDLVQRKRQYKEVTSNRPLDPKTNVKTPKKSPLWFAKPKSSKGGQDSMDEYLCPMYPVEPQIIKSPTKRKADGFSNSGEGAPQLPRIPESINV